MIYLSGRVTPGLPSMITPRMRQLPQPGLLWAADTGCYTDPDGFQLAAYLQWLHNRGADGDLERCLFATAPDVVGDAQLTLERSRPVLPMLQDLGCQAALVAQDGLERLTVPWDEFDVLFVGGSTRWKLGPAAARLVAQAKDRGKWAHMGRVNSQRRYRHARDIGCDSVDGTFLRYGPDRRRPELEAWLREAVQATLWGGHGYGTDS